MDDLISRQDLFAEMKQMYEAAEKWDEDAKTYEICARAESCMATLIEMKLRVEKMPPAEPEILRCKDCKYFAGEGMYCAQDIIVQFDHFYCYYAERRE